MNQLRKSQPMTHQVEIEPFITPNFALVKEKPRPRQEGFHVSHTIPLSELSNETLELLCEAFRREVFFKAGRETLLETP